MNFFVKNQVCISFIIPFANTENISSTILMPHDCGLYQLILDLNFFFALYIKTDSKNIIFFLTKYTIQSIW